MTMLIDANGISMKYPGSSRLVLDNVNFSINEGEVYCDCRMIQ